MVKVREDMIGWKMWEHGVPDSRLTVLKQVEDYVDKNGKHRAQYLCECNCAQHNKIIARSDGIKNGAIKSCGCLHAAMAKRTGSNNKKYNEFSEKLLDEYGEYYIGYCTNTKSKFYIDAEDYDVIKNYCWTESSINNTRRIVSRINRQTISMHKLLGCKYFDHADRNELNNRRYNLRECTRQENSRNISLRSNNKSGFIGVYFDKKSNKWHSSIRVDKQTLNLGYFSNKEYAIKARLEAEAKYFGKFAPQRHLFEQYKINVDGGDNV